MMMRYIHLTTARKEEAVGLLSRASQKLAEDGTGGGADDVEARTPGNLDGYLGQAGAEKGFEGSTR
jgi:hypothetical protein